MVGLYRCAAVRRDDRQSMVERVDVVHRCDGSTSLRRARSTALERGEHGSLACYVSCGCRCGRCRAAFRRYHRTRYAEVRAVRGQPVNRRVPVARAAAHIGRLRAAGWTVPKIAAQVGCSVSTIERIQRVAGGRARCWLVVERAVLAIRP